MLSIESRDDVPVLARLTSGTATKEWGSWGM
jgi:hypothetical protein